MNPEREREFTFAKKQGQVTPTILHATNCGEIKVSMYHQVLRCFRESAERCISEITSQADSVCYSLDLFEQCASIILLSASWSVMCRPAFSEDLVKELITNVI